MIESFKNKINIVEKSLLILTLIIGLVVSLFKGYEFITLKNNEQHEKNKALKIYVETNHNLINVMNAKISILDTELSNLEIDNKLYKSKTEVRESMSIDRRLIIKRFGELLLNK